jgi:hypothetical protein
VAVGATDTDVQVSRLYLGAPEGDPGEFDSVEGAEVLKPKLGDESAEWPG